MQGGKLEYDSRTEEIEQKNIYVYSEHKPFSLASLGEHLNS